MRRPGVGAPGLVGGGDRQLAWRRLRPPPSRSLGLHLLSGQLALACACGTAGSIRAARNATPERSAMVQGWATSPETLTGWPWRMPGPGRPGTLTARISAAPSVMAISCTRYRGSPFSSARGRLVSKSTTGSASTAHRNAIAEVSTGSFMLSLLLHGHLRRPPVSARCPRPLTGRACESRRRQPSATGSLRGWGPTAGSLRRRRPSRRPWHLHGSAGREGDLRPRSLRRLVVRLADLEGRRPPRRHPSPGGASARRGAPAQRRAGGPGRRRQLPLARRVASVGQRSPHRLVPVNRRRRAIQGHLVPCPPPAWHLCVGSLGRHELRRSRGQRLGCHRPHRGSSPSGRARPQQRKRPMTHHRSRLLQFVIDVDDLDRGVGFWSAALDATEEPLSERSRPIYRLLRLPDAEIRVLLQRTDDEKVSKERMHLDLETDDIEAEVQRLEALGATRYDHQQERGFDFWVMRDPWGNEFCVLHPNFPELLAQRRPWTT